MQVLFLSALAVVQLIFASDLIGGMLYDSTGLSTVARVGLSELTTANTPYTQVCTHDVNNMLLSVSNFGRFGLGPWSFMDCETGRPPRPLSFQPELSRTI